MAARRSPNALLAALAVTVLGLAAAPLHAHADDTDAPALPERVPLLTSELLAIMDNLDRPDIGPDWLDTHLDRMRLSDKYGLTYRHELVGSEKPMIFKIRGPVLRKPLSKHRRIGVSIEINF